MLMMFTSFIPYFYIKNTQVLSVFFSSATDNRIVMCSLPSYGDNSRPIGNIYTIKMKH